MTRFSEYNPELSPDGGWLAYGFYNVSYCRSRVSQSSHVNPGRIRALWLLPDRAVTSP